MRRGVFLLAMLLGGTVRAQAGRVPEVVTEAPLDGSQEIHFASGTWPSRAYVGQQVTYQIGIFLAEELRSRLRSNPQFVPPDIRSVIAYDLPLPARLFQRKAGDRTYDVHVFSRALFPLSPGRQLIPPARLTWSVPLTSSIFSREEAHSARSTSHELTVLEPPVAGRPAGYQGAVGRLSVAARVDASDARVGDPVLLTVKVSGVGNVGLFPRPAIALPWGHAVAGSERVRVDSSAQVIAGVKEFDWVVTPRTAGTQEVPALRYPYFNPYTEQYEVAVTTPIPVRVRAGALAASPVTAPDAEPRPTVRRVLRDDVPMPWPSHGWFWAGIALAPVPALVGRLRRRPGRAPVAPARRQLDQLVRAGGEARDVRRVARAALAERIPSLGTGLVEGAHLERMLRRAGVSAATARDARRLFAEVDERSYAGLPGADTTLASRLVATLDAIDGEATPLRPRATRGVPRRSGLWLLAILAGGAGWLGAQVSDDRTTFAEGIAAWDARDDARALERFAEVATRRPRAADAWANMGTVAWQVGDTARAVQGWQRALRLEPAADDARARLAGTPSFRDGIEGDIPPVPVDLGASLGALAWVLAWGLAARRPGARTAVAWGLAIAAVAGLGTLAVSERLRGARAVVVLGAERLRDAPAVSARPGATLLVGETGRVVATQGAWSRVRFADDREGWLDASRVASLEVPAER